MGCEFNFAGYARKIEPTPHFIEMAANITDHVWTTAELLSYRVSAQFLDQLSKIKPFFTLLEEVHQGS